jgi:hypothetical protein
MKRVLSLGAVAIVAFVLLWDMAYPDYDRKNLHYVGWKLGLLPMDSRRAVSAMTRDGGSKGLVIGKTREQLEHRFGSILTVSQVGPYLRDYCAAAWPGAEVFFLMSDSEDLMVVMERGRAVELVLCKG